ncbi:MAG: M48 family metallopeptidase [Anaerolineales bacterium]|nr:M48 family metallopeptidase [Anaerolineales bacterium]
MKTTAYRYANEHFILAITIFLVLLVIALTATATLCASVIFIIGFVVLSYSMSQARHKDLIRQARRVTPENIPEMVELIQEGIRRLQPGQIEVFVAPSRALNAYTFGLSSPKVVVLYSALFQVMDKDELLYVLGHELGHVALGHTWLNSLVGGMAGIPSPGAAYALLNLAFLWWNRACEYSADRAGLLACGRLDKSVSALVKLAAGPEADTRAELEAVYRQIDAEDDTILGSLGEALGTHPMLIRRITELRRYAGSEAYRRLQQRVEQNRL